MFGLWKPRELEKWVSDPQWWANCWDELFPLNSHGALQWKQEHWHHALLTPTFHCSDSRPYPCDASSNTPTSCDGEGHSLLTMGFVFALFLRLHLGHSLVAGLTWTSGGRPFEPHSSPAKKHHETSSREQTNSLCLRHECTTRTGNSGIMGYDLVAGWQHSVGCLPRSFP